MTPVLMIHANISADTDADADGIRITVYASHSNLFVGYMNCHIVYFPFVAHIQGKKIQSIWFSKTQGSYLLNFGSRCLGYVTFKGYNSVSTPLRRWHHKVSETRDANEQFGI